MKEKTLTFSIAPDFKNVDMVRKEIAASCGEIWGGESDKASIEDFSIAATEAMNNAVEHSGAKSIDIEFVGGGGGIAIRISTEGEKFDPTREISMPVLDGDGELPEGGFGLAIIRELVDSVEYEYSGGKNILKLKKKIP